MQRSVATGTASRLRPLLEGHHIIWRDPGNDCVLCLGPGADDGLRRVEVWEGRLRRVTVSVASEVPGCSYLELKRHIPYITDLNGEEAATLGVMLACVSTALKQSIEAELVHVYLFGDSVPHLHFHLAPHRQGDALSEKIIKGEEVEIVLEGGHKWIETKDFPALPEEEVRTVAEQVRARLRPRCEGPG